jgi:hypothetical protein
MAQLREVHEELIRVRLVVVLQVIFPYEVNAVLGHEPSICPMTVEKRYQCRVAIAKEDTVVLAVLNHTSMWVLSREDAPAGILLRRRLG